MPVKLRFDGFVGRVLIFSFFPVVVKSRTLKLYHSFASCVRDLQPPRAASGAKK